MPRVLSGSESAATGSPVVANRGIDHPGPLLPGSADSSIARKQPGSVAILAISHRLGCLPHHCSLADSRLDSGLRTIAYDAEHGLVAPCAMCIARRLLRAGAITGKDAARSR